ncbi:MAG TPA: DUF192 domain-containing protein [Candidatus Binatia bacterium]|nr:DUF192 domain-containing protein [Candidatus Binatia bacterium]
MKHLKYVLPVFVAFILAGCKKPAPTTTTTTNATAAAVKSFEEQLPTHAQPKLPTIKLYLGPEVLDAEMARTIEQIRTGMMFRTNIQETDSMIFVLPYPQQADFWMKNCPESISAAYITPEGVISEIHHLEHDDTNGVFSATDNIQFVLETKDGWFQRHHIGTGTVVRTERGTLAETFLQRR